MRFSKFAASAALVSAVAGADESLYKAMVARGRSYIGTSWSIKDGETEHPNIIKQEFNSITPENALKFEHVQPTRDNFTFADADKYYNYTKQHNLQLRCHTLIWHKQLPTWVTAGKFDNATLISIMENHIKHVAGHYGNGCTHWDVVNEALSPNGTLRPSVWYDTIGEAFLPIAFRFARQYAGNATKLYYNDFDLEFNSEKTAGAVRIVKLVQSYGAPIDGVGYQAHLSIENTPSTTRVVPQQAVLEAALRATADLGLDVAYTEIDIRMNLNTTDAKLETQAADYERLAKSCLAVERCVGMSTWGINDYYSWIRGTYPGEGAALLWDRGFKKKASYYGFLAGIEGKSVQMGGG